MGACYSVSLNVKFLPGGEAKAIKALQDKIRRENGIEASYSLDNSDMETFDGLMNIFLAHSGEWDYSDGEYRYYENDFDASYGWELVLYEMYDEIEPFLTRRSNFICDVW